MLEELLWNLLGVIAVVWLLAGPVVVILLWRRLRQHDRQIDVLRRAQHILTTRLQQSGETAQPAAPEPEPAEPRQEPIAPLFPDEGTEEAAYAPTPVAHRKPVQKPAPTEEREAVQFNVEELLAGRWMTWVGAVALIIGAGFAFKYTIDSDLIGPGGRVAIGILAGMLCFAGGAYATLREYRILGQALVGTSAGILYFSLFAGYQWYEKELSMPIAVAALGMVIVSAAVLTYAAWFDALSTAIIGLLGGFVTPLMLSRGVDYQWVLFSYILILDLGVLGVATFRKWQSLQVLAFLATIFLWLGWFAEHYTPEKLSGTLILMTCFFVLFALLSVWHNVIRRIQTKPGDFFLILTTPVVYFIGLYAVTDDRFGYLHGVLAIALAGSYLGIALFALTRNPTGRPIIISLGGVAASFLTVAIPLQLTGHWIAIAWAAESLLLVELGLRFDIRPLRYAGFGLLGVVQLILLFYSSATFADPNYFQTQLSPVDPVVKETMPIEIDGQPRVTVEPSWTDIFNGRSLSFLASALVLSVIAWEFRRRTLAETEPNAVRGPPSDTVFGWLAAGVPLSLLAMAIVETFAVGHARHWIFPTVVGWFSVWTALVALSLLVIALLNGPRWIERISIAVFGLLMLFLGTNTLATLAGWRRQWHRLESDFLDDGIWTWMFINPRGIGFLVAIVAAVVGVIFYRRAMADRDRGDLGSVVGPMRIDALLSLFAHLTALAMLTTEVYAQGVIHDWKTATALAITGTWTAYAIATLVTGIYYRSQLVRMLSLALFVLTTGKVFLYDVWHLDKAIRTFAFIGLGVALLMVSFLYRRYRDRINAWIAPVLLLAVTSVTLIAQPSPVIAVDAVPDEDHATMAQRLEYRWPIEAIKAEVDGDDESRRLCKLIVPPELYGSALLGLGDVRLLAIAEATGDVFEIPFVRLRRQDTSRIVKRPAPLLNLSERGTATEFLLDLGDTVEPVNGLVIEVSEQNQNYDRAVKVFGANRSDAEEWNQLTDHGYILDRTRPTNRLIVSDVVFPQSRFRFYKVVIENEDQPALDIAGAALFDREKTVIDRHKFLVKILDKQELPQEKTTQFILDLEFQRLPTDGITAEIEYAGNFYRPVHVEVTDHLDDEPRKTHWRTAGSGDFYKIERPGFSALNLKVAYTETTGRYLRLTVSNGDDQPLSFKSLAALGIDTLLVAERRHLEMSDRALGLYSGNEKLSPPAYDLSRTIGRFDASALATAKLGPKGENPLFGFQPVVPWSERNKPLLWSITLGGIVILGLLTFLLLKRTAMKSPTDEQP